MTNLREVLNSQLAEVLRPDSFLDVDVLTGPTVGEESPAFERNVIAFRVSREDAIGYGLTEPTPQERVDMAARAEYWRLERAAREVRRAEWFTAVREAAGPVGAAMVDLHTPGKWGDCKGDGFDEDAGLSWPCKTLLVASEAAGIVVPEEIW